MELILKISIAFLILWEAYGILNYKQRAYYRALTHKIEGDYKKGIIDKEQGREEMIRLIVTDKKYSFNFVVNLYYWVIIIAMLFTNAIAFSVIITCISFYSTYIIEKEYGDEFHLKLATIMDSVLSIVCLVGAIAMI